MTPEAGDPVLIEQRVDAPAEEVAAFVGDFRNAELWMEGVQSVEPVGEDAYKLTVETPVGKVETGIRLLEHGPQSIRWVYTSAVEGGGRVAIVPEADGSVVSYSGDFRLKGRFVGRAARFAGAERFARKNGERSLLRLKDLMEARQAR